MESGLTQPSPVDFRSKGMPAPANRYRDPVFTVLFIVHLIVWFIIAGISGAVYSKERSKMTSAPTHAPTPMPTSMTGTPSPAPSNDDDDLDIGAGTVMKIVGVLAVLALSCAVYAAFYLFLLRKFPKKMIYGTIVLSIIWAAVVAVMFFAVGAWFVAIIMLLFIVLKCVWFYLVRRRIPFAAAMLQTVVTVTNLYPNMYTMSYVISLVSIVWVIIWTVCFALGYRTALQSGSAIAYVVYVYGTLCYYWTAQVISNTMHVSLSGTYATWYFMGGANGQMPPSPLAASLKRAMTYSFGSICMGSLIVALIQLLRAMLRSATRHSGGNAAVVILSCIAQCILGCIESIVRYFNKYAYTQVAIYGKSFCEAAKDTWQLVLTHGIDAIINDSILGNIFSIGALSGGFLGALVGFLLGYAFFIPPRMTALWMPSIICCILGFLFGIVIVSLALRVLDSGICTIFVAFAMDPEGLRRNDPELFNLFHSTYHGLGKPSEEGAKILGLASGGGGGGQKTRF